MRMSNRAQPGRAIAIGAIWLAMLAVGTVAGQQAATAAPPGTGTISTLAGGIGGPGAGATVSIGVPCGLTSAGHTLLVGTLGNFGFSGGAIRAVDEQTGQLTNLAGTDEYGTSPDGALAASDRSYLSCEVAQDHQGNVVYADSAYVDAGYRQRTGNELIRVLAQATGTFYGQHMTKGHIYTIGGDGTFGFSGEGGPATQAEIGIPVGLAVDSAGNVVFATAYPTGRIRVIAAASGTFYGRPMEAGDIYTIAGGGTDAACDPEPSTGAPVNNVELDLATYRNKRMELQTPSGLRIDQAGNIVFDDVDCGGRVLVLPARNGMYYGRRMIAERLYVLAGGGKANPGNGAVATSVALNNPGGIALDHAGNIVVAETSEHSVRLIAESTGTFYGQHMTKGHLYTLAGGNGAGSRGDGGPAAQSKLDFPWAVAVDGAGNVVIADSFNYRVRVIAAKSGSFYGQAMVRGDIYTVAGNGDFHFSGDQGPALAATFSVGYASTMNLSIAGDQAGDLAVIDDGNQRVRLIAGRTGKLFGRQLHAHDIYTLLKIKQVGPQFDDFSCTSFSNPHAPCTAAWDRAGNLVLATHKYLEVIAAHTGTWYGRPMIAGHVYVIAGGGTSSASGALATKAKLSVAGLAVDGHGNIITGSQIVAEVTGNYYGLHLEAGHVFELAKGGVVQTVDHQGNVVVLHDNQVAVIAARTGTFYGQAMQAGIEYPVAGDRNTTDSGNGGPALSAGLFPWSVVVDAAGNLIIDDAGNSETEIGTVLRAVPVTSGTYYGQGMTAGHIYLIAGGGTSLANGSAALAAQITGITNLALAPGNSIVLGEGNQGVVRLLSH
jgi:hypothetical protein